MFRSNRFLKNNVRFFKKWTNKGYGIFKSLKVVVKICVLAIGYLLINRPTCAIAQSDTISVNSAQELEEVEISDRKRSVTFSELTRSVIVVTKEEIAAVPAATLQDLLEHIASIDIRQRGAHGVQSDLNIRGGSFDQVLVLLNGVNITDPQTGHHSLNLPIDLQSVERIEILQGPGARSQGFGAFSGAINIITSNDGKPYGKFSSSLGENGLMRINSSTAFKGKKTNFFLSSSYGKSDGFAENTDYRMYNLFAHAKTRFSLGYLDIQSGFQDKAFGAQSFYTPRYPNQFEKTSSFLSSAFYNINKGKYSFSQGIYFRQHRDRFELFRSNAPAWYSGHNFHSTNISGAKFTLSRLSEFTKLQAGVEYRSESIISNVLGDLLEKPKPVQGFPSMEYTKGKTRNLLSGFSDLSIYFQPITLSAGFLVASNDAFGLTYNYGIDVSALLLKNSKFYLSYNRSTRFPTFTDLYYSGPTNTGNSNLKPELADNIEFGFNKVSRAIKYSSALFYRNGKDVIDWVKKPEDEKWTTMNHTQVETKGLEVSASINLKEIVPIFQSISASYSFIDSEKMSDSLLSYYAMDYLAQKFSVSISHYVFKNLSFSWSAVWQDRAGTYTDFAAGTEVPYKPFVIVNLFVGYEFAPFHVFCDFSNLFDAHFYDLGNVPQPGRWISGGLRYNIE